MSFAFVTYSSAGGSLFKSSSLLHEDTNKAKIPKIARVKSLILYIVNTKL